MTAVMSGGGAFSFAFPNMRFIFEDETQRLFKQIAKSVNTTNLKILNNIILIWLKRVSTVTN